MCSESKKRNMEVNENKSNSTSLKSYPMNGGEGPYSYANNSCCYQQRGLEIAKALLCEEIAKKVDVKLLYSPSNSFNIADFGCSVGPNSILAVENIIKAVKLNSESQGQNPKNIEFQVFFNDHTLNDFNTLFKSLPPESERNYFVSGVPGTFHGRLFPEATLHFAYSSYSVQWLSRVPNEVQDKSSPAWNKGRILQDGNEEVKRAYASQFADDMELFLKARAVELVYGGFMALLLPCIPNGANPSKCTIIGAFELLGSSLLELVKRGLVEEAEAESFNLPYYFATPAELEWLIERNGCFKIQRMEQLARPMEDTKRQSLEKFSLTMRAGFEGIVKEHFGSEVIDELFNHYTDQLVESGLFWDSTYTPMFDIFILLKRVSR